MDLNQAFERLTSSWCCIATKFEREELSAMSHYIMCINFHSLIPCTLKYIAGQEIVNFIKQMCLKCSEWKPEKN